MEKTKPDKIRKFTDLIAWKKGHELVLEIYQVTSKFPQQELFSLTSQMKRAAISITSNIAEGFSRRTSKEKIQFYYISLGSLTELESQLILARDLKYVTAETIVSLAPLIEYINKLINGLIKSQKNT